MPIGHLFHLLLLGFQALGIQEIIRIKCRRCKEYIDIDIPLSTHRYMQSGSCEAEEPIRCPCCNALLFEVVIAQNATQRGAVQYRKINAGCVSV